MSSIILEMAKIVDIDNVCTQISGDSPQMLPVFESIDVTFQVNQHAISQRIDGDYIVNQIHEQERLRQRINHRLKSVRL